MSALSNFIRSLKATYVINNLLNAAKLKHHRPLFKRYNIPKSIYAPLSSQDFRHLPQDRPWLDQEDAWEKAQAHPGFANLSPELQVGVKTWIEEGYFIWKGLFSAEEVAAINQAVDEVMASNKVSQGLQGKIMFAYRHSAVLRKVVERKDMLEMLSFLHDRKMEPFQSLNFLAGSEQAAHSDYIHMTTYPHGFLAASWIALEEITEKNGPVAYYPGSHKLPYLTNADFPHGGSFFRIGNEANSRYEQKIAEVIEAHQLTPQLFTAAPGDVLFWHANLIHEGQPIRQKGSSRKSMVIHYFARDAICYHELTQRPALRPLMEYV